MSLHKWCRSEYFSIYRWNIQLTIFFLFLKGRNGIRTLRCLPRRCNAFTKCGKLSSSRVRIFYFYSSFSIWFSLQLTFFKKNYIKKNRGLRSALMALVIPFFLPMIDTFGVLATNIICASVVWISFG